MKFRSALLPLLLIATPAMAADYGAYLDAQLAIAEGRLDYAADKIMAALQADPNNPDLLKDAFGITLLAGRPDAAEIADRLPNNPIAELLQANQSAAAGHWEEAELAYAELPHDSLLDTLRPVLMAWSQQAQGRTDKALDALNAAMQSGRAGGFYLLHAALIADVSHRDGLAGQLYAQMAKQMTDPNVRMAQLVASWQARNGQTAAARQTIENLLRAAPEMGLAREGLLAHLDALQISDPRQGIAEAYVGLAAALRQQNHSEVPGLLLQLGTLLDPGLTEAHLVAAEIAASHHDYRSAAAALDEVSPNDPMAAVARLHQADFYARLDRQREAQAILEGLSRSYPDQPEPEERLGDLFLDEKRYDDAVAAFDRAIERTPHPVKQDWVLFYERGSAYQRLHDEARAEADMQTALKLYPDQPVVLNFIGFSWADQNRNLDQARSMIQRALDQRPDDGAIIDSLGWVLLRQGDVHGAVRLLERAAELDPMDPTITGHLGDAYWQAGRKVEAEDQWRRALVLNPEPEDAARIAARLKSATNP